MSKIHIVYEGDLHTFVTHEESGQTLHTDAPKDNQGKGETFSPSDLVAAALGSCIATIIGIYARQKQWNLKGMKVDVEKQMSKTGQRFIQFLGVSIDFPMSLNEEEKKKLEKVAHSCPVHHSLGEQTKVNIKIHYP